MSMKRKYFHPGSRRRDDDDEKESWEEDWSDADEPCPQCLLAHEYGPCAYEFSHRNPKIIFERFLNDMKKEFTLSDTQVLKFATDFVYSKMNYKEKEINLVLVVKKPFTSKRNDYERKQKSLRECGFEKVKNF